MTFLSGPRTAVMGTAKSPGLGHVHLFMGVMHEMDAMHEMGVMGVMDVSLEKEVMAGIQAESRGRVDTRVTTITGIEAQRAETRISEVTRGIPHTGDN